MATTKQKKVLDIIAENHGAIGISEAMLQAGYDPDTAKRPKNLTESDGWKELLNTYMPDSLLAERHRELLNKREVMRVYDPEAEGYVDQISDQPETQAVSKALDMAYKLKGSYAPEKSVNLQVRADITPRDEKARLIAEKYEQELFNTMMNGDTQT